MWKDDQHHGPGVLLDETKFEVAVYSNGENVVSISIKNYEI